MFFYIFYNFVANNPRIKPAIVPRVLNLPLWRLLASGNNSPETIYNMAPPANAKHSAITLLEIPPANAPKNAPRPVVTPDTKI